MTSARYIRDYPAPLALSAEMVAEFEAALGQGTFDVSDPIYYWSDEFADYITRTIEQLNAAADANNPDTATGSALNVWLRSVGEQPQQPGESTSDARIRYYIAWIALSKDTPEWAQQQVRLGSTVAKDAALGENTTPEQIPNTVPLYVANADGLPLDPADAAILQSYFDASNRHPFWIRYIITKGRPKRYRVRLKGYARVGSSIPDIRVDVLERLNNLMVERRKLDTLIGTSEMERFAHVDALISLHASIEQARDVPANDGAQGAVLPDSVTLADIVTIQAVETLLQRNVSYIYHGAVAHTTTESGMDFLIEVNSP